MSTLSSSAWLLEQETRALVARLEQIRPFVLLETSVAAAAPSPAVLAGIEEHVARGKRDVRDAARAYLRWLHGPGAHRSPVEQQRRFTALRRRFQTVLAHVDMFSEAITQRSEHDNGVLLAGLDAAAADALRLPAGALGSPPVLCSLYPGLGGSIRRARTRLPGGGETPVAMIRIPRERMISASAVGATLLHEVGHEASAQLRWVESVRAGRVVRGPWERWLPEILPDLWAVSRIGIGATLGLIALVSLPRPLVFRTPDDDPHPIPWVRVLLSCAFGDRLYPDPQWAELAGTWQRLYPPGGAAAPDLARLRADVPALADALVRHRLGDREAGEALTDPRIHREDLLDRFERWRHDPAPAGATRPTVALAVLAQARADGLITPERESRLLRRLVTGWAVTATVRTAGLAARPDPALHAGQPVWPPRRRPAPLSIAV